MAPVAAPIRRSGSGSKVHYLLALPVSLLGLIPIGYVVVESYALGWNGIQEALFRPRVADLLGNTLALLEPAS